MNIVFHGENQIFHLYNNKISYIMKVLRNGQLGHLYYGKAVRDRESFDHLLELRGCILAPGCFRGDLDFSMETIKQEYPAYGTGDYREPAYQLELEDGSRITDFVYHSHKIIKGKKFIKGLPHIHGSEEDILTLEVCLKDEKLDADLILNYHIFKEEGAIVRSSCFKNNGENPFIITRAMSASFDLYDSDYQMLQLDGAWARERHVTVRNVEKGVQSIASSRGTSSASHNPFLALKRKSTTEHVGEAYGVSLIYSGNFLGQAEVDCYDVTRTMIGINPFEFEWKLEKGEEFQTPEAVMVFSDKGLNGMSQTYHNLYRNNLMRGKWKGKSRPILINNWEATYFDFTQESILKIASKAKELGIELFVLDDGWFGARNNDSTSLGDWSVNLSKLPNGIGGLAQKIKELGMDFGLWFEPEMVNEVSELYEKHPEWVISVPGRNKSYGRNQFVLDFSRKDVVDYIFETMCKTLETADISYIKWDMNRNITEAYSLELPRDRQKEFFHRYILGVYSLYDRLIEKFPQILFESCASGGARFDPGMLYYAPQAWTSDNTDAVERLHIQYGTSMVYPIVSMGSHVAAIPNHQVDRKTSLKMRSDVAYFGTFGYELDLNLMSEEEKEEVLGQVAFFKEYREVIQLGDFYRLKNGEDQYYSWMAVSKDKATAIVGYYKILATPNPSIKKIRLQGLEEGGLYECEQTQISYYGDELMNFGLKVETEFTGLIQPESFTGTYNSGTDKGDFTSQIYVLKRK